MTLSKIIGFNLYGLTYKTEVKILDGSFAAAAFKCGGVSGATRA